MSKVSQKSGFLNKHDLLKYLMIFVVYMALYLHTIVEMIKNWNRDDNFSHGFLIPFISLYMLWQKQEMLSKEKACPETWGLVLVMLAMAMHVVGTIGAEMYTMRTSLVVCIVGITIYLFGHRIFLIVAIPIVYLLFMIPIPKIVWNEISFPLQLMAAKIATGVIQTLGISILREGNIMHLSNTTLEVVDACSGLRSLTSLLALSCAFAYLTKLRVVNKWLLFFSAIPIAIFVNIIRLTVTALLARYVGAETASGFLHDFSGVIIFFVAIVLLFLFQIVLAKIERMDSIYKKKQ